MHILLNGSVTSYLKVSREVRGTLKMLTLYLSLPMPTKKFELIHLQNYPPVNYLVKHRKIGKMMMMIMHLVYG